MSFKDKNIEIIDWVGNKLYQGPYDDDDAVDAVLQANRCSACLKVDGGHKDDCKECNDTGYDGDFSVCWSDESDKNGCNVYEYINY